MNFKPGGYNVGSGFIGKVPWDDKKGILFPTEEEYWEWIREYLHLFEEL